MIPRLNLLTPYSLCIVASLAVAACVASEADRDHAAIKSLTVTPAATSVSVYEVVVNGAAQLQYQSEEPVTVEIQVNGVAQKMMYFSAASTTQVAFPNVTVPLTREGPNEILTRLRYDGDEATETDTVTVTAPAVAVTFPAWATTHDQTQNVAVVPTAGWKVDLVEYSVDNAGFVAAKPGTAANAYSVALTNLDIGDSALTLRVLSSNLGHSKTDLFYSTITGIAPEFNCAATSMVPSNNMLRDNGTEVRTLLGYFGNPGEHTATFTTAYLDVNANAFQNVGSMVNYGRDSITAEFEIGNATCDLGTLNNRHDCSTSYELRVSVDGQPIATCPNFGVVNDYHDS